MPLPRKNVTLHRANGSPSREAAIPGSELPPQAQHNPPRPETRQHHAGRGDPPVRICDQGH